MPRWEYCEVWWETKQVTINIFSVRGFNQQIVRASDWPNVFAHLGADGWELTSTMPSPTGVQQYFYYFKRPLL